MNRFVKFIIKTFNLRQDKKLYHIVSRFNYFSLFFTDKDAWNKKMMEYIIGTTKFLPIEKDELKINEKFKTVDEIAIELLAREGIDYEKTIVTSAV